MPSQVTVVSEHLKSEIQKLVPEISLETISMGVNIEKFGKQYYVPDYFGQGDKKVILFVGRLAEKKGVKYLIEAMRNIDAMLVIVGDGPLRTELEEQANGVNKCAGIEKIKFIGAKTHDKLRVIYASADVFVAPSITAKNGDKEGLPTVLLEAMASGLPTVASKISGIPQLIKDGENGLLCDEKCVWQLADNICSLLDDESLYKKIAENGKETARKYDYSHISQKYSQVLMACANKKSLH